MSVEGYTGEGIRGLAKTEREREGERGSTYSVRDSYGLRNLVWIRS